jgi:hypothetical protein
MVIKNLIVAGSKIGFNAFIFFRKFCRDIFIIKPVPGKPDSQNTPLIHPPSTASETPVI